MNEKTVLGDNEIDDVRWLCSLNDAELDLLIGLKSMAIMRAKQIGHEALANKFALKLLRKLSLIYMEDLKGRLKDVPSISGFDTNLLKENPPSSFASMTIEELYPYVCSDKKKRVADMFFEDVPSSRKQKKQHLRIQLDS